jgi:adenylate cyclase
MHYAFRAASPAQLGNSRAGAVHAREVIQRELAFTAEGFLGTLDHQQHSDKEHQLGGLVQAGLPP